MRGHPVLAQRWREQPPGRAVARLCPGGRDGVGEAHCGHPRRLPCAGGPRHADHDRGARRRRQVHARARPRREISARAAQSSCCERPGGVDVSGAFARSSKDRRSPSPRAEASSTRPRAHSSWSSCWRPARRRRRRAARSVRRLIAGISGRRRALGVERVRAINDFATGAVEPDRRCCCESLRPPAARASSSAPSSPTASSSRTTASSRRSPPPTTSSRAPSPNGFARSTHPSRPTACCATRSPRSKTSSASSVAGLAWARRCFTCFLPRQLARSRCSHFSRSRRDACAGDGRSRRAGRHDQHADLPRARFVKFSPSRPARRGDDYPGGVAARRRPPRALRDLGHRHHHLRSVGRSDARAEPVPNGSVARAENPDHPTIASGQVALPGQARCSVVRARRRASQETALHRAI